MQSFFLRSLLDWETKEDGNEVKTKQEFCENCVLQNKNNKKNYDDMCTCFTAVVLRKDP